MRIICVEDIKSSDGCSLATLLKGEAGAMRVWFLCVQLSDSSSVKDDIIHRLVIEARAEQSHVVICGDLGCRAKDIVQELIIMGMSFV